MARIAVVVIKVNCGCGARFTSVEDAKGHATQTGHTLDVLGKVEPQEKAPVLVEGGTVAQIRADISSRIGVAPEFIRVRE